MNRETFSPSRIRHKIIDIGHDLADHYHATDSAEAWHRMNMNMRLCVFEIGSSFLMVGYGFAQSEFLHSRLFTDSVISFALLSIGSSAAYGFRNLQYTLRHRHEVKQRASIPIIYSWIGSEENRLSETSRFVDIPLILKRGQFHFERTAEKFDLPTSTLIASFVNDQPIKDNPILEAAKNSFQTRFTSAVGQKDMDTLIRSLRIINAVAQEHSVGTTKLIFEIIDGLASHSQIPEDEYNSTVEDPLVDNSYMPSIAHFVQNNR